MRISLFCLSLLLPLAAFAADDEDVAPKKATDYTHCNMPNQNYMGYEPTHMIGENGGLDFKANDKRVVSFTREENEETLYVRDVWSSTEGKTKVVLKKENGRPIWVMNEMDPKAVEAGRKMFPKEMQDQPMFASWKVSFGYSGDKCFVKETSVKMTDGKESVAYDRALCNNLLALTKKATAKKLMECKMTFAQMADAIHKAKAKFSKEGRSLAMGYFGSPLELKEFQQTDNDMVSMMMVGSCNMTRMSYGESMDPDTQMGGGFVMGIGGAYAPKPVGLPMPKEKEEKGTDPAN